jgi:hypothetical protein
VLSFCLHLGLPGDLSLWGFPRKALYVSSVLSQTCYLTFYLSRPFNLIALTIFGGEQILRRPDHSTSPILLFFPPSQV